ncbi:MAG: acetylornithine/N-succinyldiaminopimelate aminotransferase [Mycobacterium sp.]|jgi:acetylornithine aminotransferase|nr:acetylornithine/N-succinyldiaminopimelate aminotransferase [Mycobacterium sp.]MDT5276919.1 acetylornithine/N-succinyldiaminopimelate aminotransferase [Mycobacterium sp.]
MTRTQKLQERWSAVMMNNYGVPPVALASGDGAVVTDVDGKSYLDLLGGIAVNVLGHGHPAVLDAVTRQMSTLGHTSNFYAAEPGIALAEALVGLLGADAETRVFFCNSGTEANELAFKLSRLTGRTKLVAAQEAFHGRTMGALALTGQPAKQAPFAPLPGDVTHVPYGDANALAAAVDDETAAVFLEPIMGESGIVVPPDGYLAAARDITSGHGALLVLDEVQTGMGRTGTFFAHQHDGITPDVVTLAKGLGGGLPIGACLAVGPAAQLLTPGLHGSTFGGNPICAAAALAVLRVLTGEDLVRRAGVLGKTLHQSIESLHHPLIDHVRGRGLLCGVVLTAPTAKEVEAAARAAGFLVNAAAPDVVRLAPPLIITEHQIDTFVTALPGILDLAAEGAQ